MADWYLPVGHETQVSEAPVAAENLPAAQDTQESEVPTVVRYLPATQLMHMLAAAAVHLPAPQLAHVEATEAPVAVEYLPAAQNTHVVADNGDAAYFPAPHSVQSASPSLAECLPAHRQWRISAKESAASRA